MGKPLPKYILTKLTDAEKKKLEELEAKSASLGDEMVMHQAEYVKAAMKDENDPRLQKMANKGFKYEYLAFAAADKVGAYKMQLRKKYTH
jgi:hypothetical protein